MEYTKLKYNMVQAGRCTRLRYELVKIYQKPISVQLVN